MNIQLEKEDFDQQKGKLLITEQNVYNILIATVIVPLQYIIKLIKILWFDEEVKNHSQTHSGVTTLLPFG